MEQGFQPFIVNSHVDTDDNISLGTDPVVLYAEQYLDSPWRAPDMYVSNPMLSVVVIAHDGAWGLSSTLENVRSVADELVVITMDDTADVVAGHIDATIVPVECVDAASVRSVISQYATGGWILVINAGEELGFIDRSQVRNLLETTEFDGLFLSEFSASGAGAGMALYNLSFRLWRNQTDGVLAGDKNTQGGGCKAGIADLKILCPSVGDNIVTGCAGLNLNASALLAEEDLGEIAALYNLGAERIGWGDLEGALDAYKQAFASLPASMHRHAPSLVRNITLCLRELGRTDEARSVIADAIEAYSDFSDLYHLDGAVLFDAGEFADAAECFATCVNMGPASQPYIGQAGVGGYLSACMLGDSLAAIGRNEDAVNAYRHALSLNPRFEPALVALGESLGRTMKPEELKETLEQLIDATSDTALLAVARVLVGLGHYAYALDYLDRLQSITSIPEVTVLKGQCLVNVRRYGEALGMLGSVNWVEQPNIDALTDTALCYALVGDYENARQTIDTFKDHQEYRVQYELYRALLCALSCEPITHELSRDELYEALDSATNVLRKLLDLKELGAFERATAVLSHLGCADGETDLLLGKIYYDAGHNDLAVERLIGAYECDAADGEAFFILGRTALSSECYEEAKIFFYEALERGIEEYALYISLARALTKLGQIREALDVIDVGAEKYPDAQLIKEIKQSIAELI
ncbi:MAG TPA: hypothetical protein VGK02_11155 [Candidatus Aquicultor sp.]|jgi:tetratricopeptide (TPR) repeat protein